MAEEEVRPEHTYPARDIEAAQRKARENHRQFLIDSVWHDEMTPSEAEAAAAANLIEINGPACAVTFDTPRWPLALAVLFIVWRDQDLTLEQWQRFQAWQGDLWRDPPDERHTVSFEQAEAQLWAALEAGKVRATGLQELGPRPVEINALAWSNLVWMPEKHRFSVRYFAQSDPAYRLVDVYSIDVLKMWPKDGDQALEAAASAVAAPEQPPPDPRKRGGGAPQQYDWDAMWIEVVRLATEDKITDRPSLSKHLREWFVEQTGDGPGETIFKAKMAKLFTTLGWK